MQIKELLPLGSVVRMKDGEKKLVVIGVKQADSNAPDVEYDYLGILYPEGHIGAEFQYLFNHEDIEQIYFRGYEDEEGERANFIERLATIYGQ